MSARAGRGGARPGRRPVTDIQVGEGILQGRAVPLGAAGRLEVDAFAPGGLERPALVRGILLARCRATAQY